MSSLLGAPRLRVGESGCSSLSSAVITEDTLTWPRAVCLISGSSSAGLSFSSSCVALLSVLRLSFPYTRFR